MKRKIVTVIILSLICFYFSSANGPYKIRRVMPKNKTILIGKQPCGVGSVFYGDQVVHWDKALYQQAFEADDVRNPNLTIGMSKLKANNKDVSYNQYKYSKGLISKGDALANILWPEDTLKIPIDVDSTCNYYIHIQGSYEFKDVVLNDDLLIVTHELFGDLSGMVKFDIVKSRDWEIEYIKQIEVEVLKY